MLNRNIIKAILVTIVATLIFYAFVNHGDNIDMWKIIASSVLIAWVVGLPLSIILVKRSKDLSLINVFLKVGLIAGGISVLIIYFFELI